MKKKILVFILSIITVLCAMCFVACDGNGDKSNNEDAPIEVEKVFNVIDGTIVSLTEYGKGLENIVIPSEIDGQKIVAIYEGALSGCYKLKELTIPFVGESIDVEENSYKSCFGYIFGQNSYYGSERIDVNFSVFYYIPQSLKKVTVLGREIKDNAFIKCSILDSVIIGNGVTSIGNFAFV